MIRSWYCNEDRAHRELTRLVLKRTLPQLVWERCVQELQEVKHQRLARNCMLGKLIREWCIQNHFGQCLWVGLWGNSQVIYQLGLTSISPLEYSLPFERCWNPALEPQGPVTYLELHFAAIPFLKRHLREIFGELCRELPIDQDGRLVFRIMDSLHLEIRESFDPSLRCNNASHIPLDDIRTWQKIKHGLIQNSPGADVESRNQLLMKMAPTNIRELATVLELCKSWNSTKCPSDIHFDTQWMREFVDATGLSMSQAAFWWKRMNRRNQQHMEEFQHIVRYDVARTRLGGECASQTFYEVVALHEALRAYHCTYLGNACGYL